MPPTPGAVEEGAGGKKKGISAAAGTINQTCVFIGSDLDGSIGSDLDGKASRTASCWDPIHVRGIGGWGGEVGSGGVAASAPLALVRRARV